MFDVNRKHSVYLAVSVSLPEVEGQETFVGRLKRSSMTVLAADMDLKVGEKLQTNLAESREDQVEFLAEIAESAEIVGAGVEGVGMGENGWWKRDCLANTG
jgi:flagella basal body P-ring formation protein FlgA